jgi:hypothetical protein
VRFEDESDFGNIEFTPDGGENIPKNVEDKFSSVDLDHLEKPQREAVLRILQKYEHVFSDKTGFCDVHKHTIELQPGYKPKSFKPYRIPETLKAEVSRQIDILLEDGKIQESDTPWVHPIVCVIKPDSSIRMCVNYKYVNAGTIAQPYYFPRIEDIIRKVGGRTFISKFDATQGYYQVALDEGSRQYTGFICHRGVFTFNVLPFGLSYAAQTYMRVMDKVLLKHKRYADAYIDDVAVSSQDFKAHLHHLDSVLSSISEAGITLKLKKCEFARRQTQLLGFKVGSGEISILKSKVEAIQQLSPPTTKKLLRSFLGLCNYFRAYIPNFADVAYPLTELTKQKQSSRITFNQTETDAFVKLKNLLGSAPILVTPNYELPFYIFCDASEKGAGCVLFQKDSNGLYRPIAYASKKFTPTMTRWSAVEREAYSVIFALQQFEIMVFGCKIILYTDHDPLKYITDVIPTSSKLTRWMLALQRFQISIHHIPGKENLTADLLSRL